MPPYLGSIHLVATEHGTRHGMVHPAKTMVPELSAKDMGVEAGSLWRLWPVEMGVEDWLSRTAQEEGSGQSWVHGGKRLKE